MAVEERNASQKKNYGNRSYDKRLDRIEEFLYYADNGDSLKAWMSIQSTKLDGVVEAVKILPALKISVELHHNEPHLWAIVKSAHFWPRLISIIIIGFIVLHTMATYLPNAWDWAMTLVGIPHLIIPLQ